MKLILKKDIKVANPIVSKPHWTFKEDQEVDTDNEYLISTLLDNKFAKKFKEEKMKEAHENKKLDISLNKSAV